MKPQTQLARRVAHVTDSPEDHRLLSAELADSSPPVQLLRARSAGELRRTLEAQPVDLVVADLPLEWPGAHDDLANLQRDYPEIEFLFRWGEPGARTFESEAAQVERLVAERLALRPTRAQNEGERRATMRELARRQDLLLRIQRQSPWDFDTSLRETTRAAAELLGVERVSVWEFTHDHSRLECAMLYKRGTKTFERGEVITSHPRYFRALESSLAIAAHDSIHDPRTSEFADEYLQPLGIPSILDAPIRLDGGVAGVLCIEHVGEQRHWTILDQCAASTLASHVARVFETRRRREAEQRLAALERLDALGRVAGQIAHDFNNRLTVLTGWVGLLRHDIESGSSAARCVAELESELDKASALVRELLSLGRGAPQPAAQRCELRAEVERQLPMLGRVLGAGVRLEFHADQELPPAPLGPRDLEALLQNLATNARDALAGSGTVRIALEALTSGAAAPGTRLIFEDDGPGFSEQALAHAFEPLFTTKATQRGSGLGLASIARSVRLAGGAVRALNRTPHGARIEIELPAAR